MNTFRLLKTKFEHLKSRKLCYEDIREKNLQKNERLREIKLEIDSMLSTKDMENVSFEIEESEDLALDPRTGKFPLVVRDNLKSVK